MLLQLLNISQALGARLYWQPIQKLFNWAFAALALIKENLPRWRSTHANSLIDL